MKIELVISDNCSLPQLITGSEITRVLIGLDHDFDDILDICSGHLTNDEIALVHRLWSDDEFPREFIREGSELRIIPRA